MDSTSAQNPSVPESASIATGGAFKRAFNRIFTRHLMNMAVLTFFLFPGMVRGL